MELSKTQIYTDRHGTKYQDDTPTAGRWWEKPLRKRQMNQEESTMTDLDWSKKEAKPHRRPAECFFRNLWIMHGSIKDVLFYSSIIVASQQEVDKPPPDKTGNANNTTSTTRQRWCGGNKKWSTILLSRSVLIKCSFYCAINQSINQSIFYVLVLSIKVCLPLKITPNSNNNYSWRTINNCWGQYYHYYYEFVH